MRFELRDFAFRHFTPEQGLSEAVVRCIAQDARGYMWVGTQDGLDRFDGYTFTVFRHDSRDRASLPNNSISSLAPDPDGSLWIGTTGGGISRYMPSLSRFINFQHSSDVNSISDNSVSFVHRDRGGALWVGTEFGGLNRLDTSTGKFTHFKHNAANPDSLAENSVTAIGEDAAGALWIGTRHSGVDRMDVGRGRFVHFRNASPRANNVGAIRVDGSRIWSGTEAGLYVLDAQSAEFRRFASIGSDSQPITSLAKDQKGRLWIGAMDGLHVYTEDGRMRAVRNTACDPSSLGSDTIYALFEDKDGNMWIGLTGGLDLMLRASSKFRTYRASSSGCGALKENLIKAVASSRDGRTLWTGTEAGVFELNLTTGETRKRESASPYTTALLIDDDGSVWIGTRRGLDHVDSRTGRLEHFEHAQSDKRSLTDDLVWFIYRDREQRLWIGTQSGLNLYLKSGGFHRYVHDASNPASLADDDIRAMVQDHEGGLWIGTRHAGLDRFDPQTGTFFHQRHNSSAASTLANNAVFALDVDLAGTMWVGTTQGLDRYDPKRRAFSHLTRRNGLPNETIYCVRHDRSNHIWASTDAGLSEYIPQTGEFRNFDVSDGLQGDEFNGGASGATESGTLIFGGVNGFTTVSPGGEDDGARFAPLILESVSKVGGAPEPVIEGRPLVLGPRDYFMSIEFAALDYGNSNKVRYQYKLTGLDAQWHEAGYRRVATYTNLSPGSYTLEVRAAEESGHWSATPAMLRILVIPPFWKRTPFLSSVVCALMAAIWLLYRRRVMTLLAAREAQRAFSRQLIDSQETERKRISRELHDSLGQDLLVIKNLALRAVTVNGSSRAAPNRLEEISSVASGALNNLREIARALRPYQLDRLGLARAIESMCDTAANSCSVEFSRSIDRVDGLLPHDDEILFFRVIQEAVNNILKHSEASGATIAIEKTDSSIRVKVSDDGAGFDSSSHNGSGFGLQGMSERVRMLGAQLQIHSAPGRGTLLQFEIPLRKGSRV